MIILIPASVGELIDKITILQLKVERLSSREQLSNIQYELGLLTEVRAKHGIEGPEFEKKVAALKIINSALWEVEDLIRDCERRNDFRERFIELARSVYKLNDKRAAAKRDINSMFGSDITEEKSYTSY